MVLANILLATLSISLISVIGIVLLFNTKFILEKSIFYLVGLSTGALLGGAFFHLLPESIEFNGVETTFIWALVSFGTFFLTEKILHWHHCHDEDCEVKTVGYMNLFGDGIHNFIDGIIIAGAFAIDVNLGIASTIAIAFHEIPQEFGDFAVLIHSGFTKSKALFYNLMSALMAVLGGVLGYFFISTSAAVADFLLPIAAGSFLYISASDLVPELREENHLGKSLVTFALFVAGIVLMYFLATLE